MIKWRPSIHMPRWASRITLEITKVRVERLHEISEDDAIAEGCEDAANPDFDHADPMDDDPYTFRAGFAQLWRKINGAESWDANPWVWCISFRRVNP